MKNKKKLLIPIVLIIAIVIIAIIFSQMSKKELLSVKSERQLMKIYEGYDNYSSDGYLKLFAMPLYGILDLNVSLGRYDKAYIPAYGDASIDSTTESNTTTSSSTKEYSTTNLQVENVDEADITKTDGNYIYSISKNKVIITNVQDPTNIKIEKEIYTNTDYVPEDLMLYKEKLIVISTQYLNHAKSNTMVTVYDITTKSNPKLVKEYTLLARYYTSRCINGKLYVISSERLRKVGDNIVREYIENDNHKEIKLDDIK